MSVRARLGVVAGMLLVVIALVGWAVGGFLLQGPAAVDFSPTASGGVVDLTVQTVGSIGYGAHPTWVSYMVKAPSGHWVHSTIWQVPANTRVDLTIEQFDSGSPLRNQEWGQVQGTRGDVEYLNGKAISTYDSYTGNGVGHTFTIPGLGVSVPLVGVSGSANLCGEAPCSLSQPHNTIKVSFRTHGPGEYSWQCFVPCGLGYLYGNGGPMSTLGYMGGFLDVTA